MFKNEANDMSIEARAGEQLACVAVCMALEARERGVSSANFILSIQKKKEKTTKSTEKKVERKPKNLRRFLFSNLLYGKSYTHKIAYIAVMTALMVAGNMFEIKLAETQFSFTLALSAITGIMIGPLFGFTACFLGDLVGFLYHSAGYIYMPWIGLSMGLTAAIAGCVVNGISLPKPWGIYVKLLLVALLTFAICTVAINTTAFWFLYAKTSYTTYLISRLFVQGQIWNSLLNYALLFVVIPILGRVKPLKMDI